MNRQLAFLFLAIVIVFSSCKQQEEERIRLPYLLDINYMPGIDDVSYYRVSSYDTTGGNIDRINIPSASTMTIFKQNGPGLIRRIWFNTEKVDEAVLRGLVLRMYWENAETPSVEVPFGDFFGSGMKDVPFSTPFTSGNNASFYSYFPMPFKQAARIEIANDASEELSELYFQIDYYLFDKPLEDDTPLFHAHWQRNKSTIHDSDIVILATNARGYLAGLNINVQTYGAQADFWGSDEKIWIDGEPLPRAHGTGINALFQTDQVLYDGNIGLYGGVLQRDDAAGTFIACRYFIADPLPFNTSLLMTLEHGSENLSVIDISHCVYWYQDVVAEEGEKLPVYGLRKPMKTIVPSDAYHAEDLIFKTDETIEAISMDMSNFGADWNGNQQLYAMTRNLDNFSLTIPFLNDLAYNVDVYMSSGPDLGIVYISPNGSNARKFIDAYAPEYMLSEPIRFENVRTKNNQLQMDFHVMGKNLSSAEFYVGIDAISLEPVRTFIPHWEIIGPYPNLRASDLLRYGLDEVFRPENASVQPTEAEMHGLSTIGHPFKVDRSGYSDLSGYFQTTSPFIAYAQVFVYSPDNQENILFLGMHDGIKVFLNDQELYRSETLRHIAPDQEAIPLPLKKGWNKLLLKLENNRGDCGFYARIRDNEQKLKYSLKDRRRKE